MALLEVLTLPVRVGVTATRGTLSLGEPGDLAGRLPEGRRTAIEA